MDIYLDKRAVRQIRLSASDAIDAGDIDTLREDLIDAFSEEQVEEIERRTDSGDIHEFIGEILEEWSVEDIDELFELLEGQLSDIDCDLKYQAPELDDDEEEDDDDDSSDDDDDDDDGDLVFDEEEL